jgi:SNF2 family DNA or RNA helicase
LSLVDLKTFDSYWKFIHKWCVITKTVFGQEIERNPRNISAFRIMLGNYMIRRLKEEVLDELPGKMRQSLYVKMSAKQEKVYWDLTNELMAEIPDSNEVLITPSQMALILRQRMLLACPQALGLKERGVAIDTIIEHSHLKLDENKPVVVFTPFRKALSCMKDAFKEEYPGIEVYEIKGQMTAKEFGDSWQGFQSSKKQRVLLCIIKSGASFNCTEADTAYFLGYEWDFNQNEQCEDRLNRMGQKNFVNVFYLMTKNTVDEHVAAVLNEKKTASNLVVGTEKQYFETLKRYSNNKAR